MSPGIAPVLQKSEGIVDYRDVVNSMHDAVIVVDRSLTIQFANLGFYRLMGRTEEMTLGHPLLETHEQLWSDPSIGPLLNAIFEHDVVVNRVTLEETFPIIGRRIIKLSARRVVRDGINIDRLLIVLSDVTLNEMASEAVEETIERTNAMMTEVNHRVKNNLASIRSMLRIEARGVADEASKDVLERIGLRVDSMATLYELLAVASDEDGIDLLDYFRKVCRTIEQISRNEQVGWSIEVDGDDVTVPFEMAVTIGAIVNELVANAAKYAFLGRQDIGRIVVEVRRMGSDILLTVADNGNGFDKDNTDPKSTGLGMKLVHLYLESIHGSMDRTEDEGGTVCRLRIPYVDEGAAAQRAASLPTMRSDRLVTEAQSA